jgi:uncharacterized Fe-S radical SAM superfamily protein PflX
MQYCSFMCSLTELQSILKTNYGTSITIEELGTLVEQHQERLTRRINRVTAGFIKDIIDINNLRVD